MKKINKSQTITTQSQAGKWKLTAALALLAGLTAISASAVQVYVGGGDNDAGAFNGYLSNPSAWTFVRANADGYYINNFALNTDPNSTQSVKLGQMQTLFTQKNIFYETDYQATTDYADKVKIDIMRSRGWNVAVTTCNRGLDYNRIAALQWRAWRPVLAMIAPWEINGDINSVPSLSSLIDISDGSATDGPMGYWMSNQGQMHGGSYSMVSYSHASGQTAMCMVAPYSAGVKPWSDSTFLKGTSGNYFSGLS